MVRGKRTTTADAAAAEEAHMAEAPAAPKRQSRARAQPTQDAAGEDADKKAAPKRQAAKRGVKKAAADEDVKEPVEQQDEPMEEQPAKKRGRSTKAKPAPKKDADSEKEQSEGEAAEPEPPSKRRKTAAKPAPAKKAKAAKAEEPEADSDAEAAEKEPAPKPAPAKRAPRGSAKAAKAAKAEEPEADSDAEAAEKEPAPKPAPAKRAPRGSAKAAKAAKAEEPEADSDAEAAEEEPAPKPAPAKRAPRGSAKAAKAAKAEEPEADSDAEAAEKEPAPKPAPAKRAPRGSAKAAKAAKAEEPEADSDAEAAEEEPAPKPAPAKRAPRGSAKAAKAAKAEEPEADSDAEAAEKEPAPKPAPAKRAPRGSAKAAKAAKAEEPEADSDAEAAEEEPAPKPAPAKRAPRGSGKAAVKQEETGAAKAAPAKRGRKAAAKPADEEEEGKAAEEEVGEVQPPPAKRARKIAKEVKEEKEEVKVESEAQAEAAGPSQAVAPVAAAVEQRRGYRLYIWGETAFGVLGLGDELNEKQRPFPLAVGDDVGVESVAAGGMHTVCLDVEGRLWSWGVNDEGSLGRPTKGAAWQDADGVELGPADHPGLMTVPKGLGKVLKVVVGDGFTLVLTQDGCVWGCGQLKDDQISENKVFAPGVELARTLTQVYFPGADQDRAVQLSSGLGHAVLLTKGGSVLSWGAGSQGQLGRVPRFTAENPASNDVLFTPTVVPLSQELLQGDEVETICTGNWSTFAITNRGRVIAWGLNNFEQLGLPRADEQDNIVWEPQVSEVLEGARSISGGTSHTVALFRDGSVRTLGDSQDGMLGRAALKDKPRGSYGVEAVDKLASMGPIACIAANNRVCGCVTQEGQAYLWGANTTQQMASGKEEDNDLGPEKLPRTKHIGWRPIRSLAFGGQHAVMLTERYEDLGLKGPASP